MSYKQPDSPNHYLNYHGRNDVGQLTPISSDALQALIESSSPDAPWYRRLWWRVRNWWGNVVSRRKQCRLTM